MSDDLDLSITDTFDLDLVAEVTDTVLNLDLVLEELLEGGNVEDLIGGRLGSVDDVLLEQKMSVFRYLCTIKV